MVKKIVVLLALVGLCACSKKEDAPPANNPHVSGMWSGNGTDDAIGYYDVSMDLTQSSNQASGTFTMAGQVATINGNIQMSFGAISSTNVGAMTLDRKNWTVADPKNAGRVCSATMTIVPNTASISNTTTTFHYTVTDCQGGTWTGGANLHKVAGTN